MVCRSRLTKVRFNGACLSERDVAVSYRRKHPAILFLSTYLPVIPAGGEEEGRQRTMFITLKTPSEAMIDQTLADSFPASDSPSWTLGRYVQPGLRAEVALPIEAQNDEPANTISPDIGGG
jgi:hypothetical protein